MENLLTALIVGLIYAVCLSTALVVMFGPLAYITFHQMSVWYAAGWIFIVLIMLGTLSAYLGSNY